MITNLPLLFANGQPTSLSKMTLQELERFIPFLVHCSWGHDTAKSIQRPNWWPSDIRFSVPLVRPGSGVKDWADRLRELVASCYKTHCSEFLLKFCDELSKNDPTSLLSVSNSDGTTSLYLKSTRRLLVTFRNENILYDKNVATTSRKYLLPQRPRGDRPAPEAETVELYLCDTCDDVFENVKDLNAHERVCSARVDARVPSPDLVDLSSDEEETLSSDTQPSFLAALGLYGAGVLPSAPSPVKHDPRGESRGKSERQRKTVIFNGLTNFPFSSPAGVRTLKIRQRWQPVGRQKDVDRHCVALPTSSFVHIRNRYHNRFPNRYKKTNNFWTRHHTFPDQRGKMILDLESQLLYLKCRPCRVLVNKMSDEDIRRCVENMHKTKTCTVNSLEQKCDAVVSTTSPTTPSKYVQLPLTKFFIVKREPSGDRGEGDGTVEPLRIIILKQDPNGDVADESPEKTPRLTASDSQMDTIDLCSDDEEHVKRPPPAECLKTSDLGIRECRVNIDPITTIKTKHKHLKRLQFCNGYSPHVISID